ncbi:SET domain containing protein [Cryptosporidium felis]|nr:SET domain containing protein [Cryptosporidium felis]
MEPISSRDDWLSYELQRTFAETRKICTKFDLSNALINFEERNSRFSSVEFVSPKITLRKDPSGGKNWRSTGTILEGQLILSEKSFSWEIHQFPELPLNSSLLLWKKVIRKCNLSERLFRKLKLLFPRTQSDIEKIRRESSDYKIPSKEIKEYLRINNLTNISLNDALRLYLVVKFNKMSINFLPELWKNPFHWSETFFINSLYVKSSFFNHSCDPNVGRFFIGTVAIFKALRPIKPNEDLTICYIETEFINDPLWVRCCELNFWCLCHICQREGRFAPTDTKQKISQAIKDSRRINKRSSVLTQTYLGILKRMGVRERALAIEDLLRNNFLNPVQGSRAPIIVSLDASKLMGFLIHDYVSTRRFQSAKLWLNLMSNIIKVKDEHAIPVFVLLGLISEGEVKYRYFRKAVRIASAVFGNNVTFFMKRYWKEIRYFGKMLYQSRRERNFYLRRASNLIRELFLIR